MISRKCPRLTAHPKRAVHRYALLHEWHHHMPIFTFRNHSLKFNFTFFFLLKYACTQRYFYIHFIIVSRKRDKSTAVKYVTVQAISNTIINVKIDELGVSDAFVSLANILLVKTTKKQFRPFFCCFDQITY